MAFVIISEEMNFNGRSKGELKRFLEKLAAIIRVAKKRKQKLWRGDDLDKVDIFNGYNFWDLLTDRSLVNISPELSQELLIWLDRSDYYADEKFPPDFLENLDIAIDGGAFSHNVDLAWVHHMVRFKQAVACIGIARFGVHRTTSRVINNSTVDVHWVSDEKSNLGFWRDAIDVTGGTAQDLERLAPNAFPDLFFVDGVWFGLNDLSHGYLPLQREIRRYLEVLNDFGRWVFVHPPPATSVSDTIVPDPELQMTDKILKERFMKLGLDIVPEKKNIRTHETSRKLRERTLDSRILYCQWHGRLEGHRNRMHIHAPVAESNDKVVIAIFHKHL